MSSPSRIFSCSKRTASALMVKCAGVCGRRASVRNAVTTSRSRASKCQGTCSITFRWWADMGTAELVAFATFVGVLLIVVGPYLLLVVRPETATRDVLRQRIKTGGAAVPPKKTGPGLLKEVERLSTN